MHGDAAEIRVNIWLRRRILHKSAAFFVTLFFLGTAVNRAEASVSEISENIGKTITVTAEVPLFPEFVYAVRRNSMVSVKNSAVVVGDEFSITVKLMSGRQSLSNHDIQIAFTNKSGREKRILFGRTDIHGEVSVRFSADTSLRGRNEIRVTDLSYGEPIELFSQPILVVYEIENEAEKSQKTGKKSIGSPSIQFAAQDVSHFAIGEEVFTESDTMGKMALMLTYIRAEPGDP